MFAICEEIDGLHLWARRRGWPGEGGLGWHMGSSSALEPAGGDVGLLTGTRQEMQSVADGLTRMRWSRGMTSSVTLVEIDDRG
jgi:hypothetical protein